LVSPPVSSTTDFIATPSVSPPPLSHHHHHHHHHQLWYRNSFNLPSQPSVLFLDPGLGARDPGAEKRTEERPHPWKTGAADWYTDLGYSIATQVRMRRREEEEEEKK